MTRYFPQKIEQKWQKAWLKEKIYEPDLKRAKKPFYNLMMFPYPSAEGLHVGNMYAFTGSDIYGRFKRMQGFDVFEPIGLDGFGIHSENYALKIGVHPAKQAKISEKRFYKQLEAIGNGFAWKEKLETYAQDYYKWTQWIFVQMFKKGLAYRKKQAVNWCPSCMTVLADEQVIQKSQIQNYKFQTNSKPQISNSKQKIIRNICERCETPVVKKELEQWFFGITNYAERLLKNIEKLDWSERVKIAQREWIGKSEGAEIDFPIANNHNYVLLHGFRGSSKNNFFPWLEKELKKRGAKVFVPDLPNPENPSEKEQVDFVLKNSRFDENTIIFGHSLGAVVAMKVVEKINAKIAGLVLAGGFVNPDFKDNPRPFKTSFNWKFDFGKIKNKTGFIKILSDKNDYAVPAEQGRNLFKELGGTLIETESGAPHFTDKIEPDIIQALAPTIKVFTTRPDTLFGATYMVLSPEHAFVASLLGTDSRGLYADLRGNLKNEDEVRTYIKKAKEKTDEERIAEGHDKTGVELKGIKAINPANNEEIPIWVADYVLANVGTGAIMAVPAHDDRDFEFAKKYNLVIKPVIMPKDQEAFLLSSGVIKEYRVTELKNNSRYEFFIRSISESLIQYPTINEGVLINSSDKFDLMPSEKAKWEITKFVNGEKKIQYHLRDWLISRQRYWGAPIPMIYCEHCANNKKGGQEEMLGWYSVPEKDLPVKLPMVKDFRPKGMGQSPLASVKSFYEVKCPVCGKKARRETDVSDTFLDSAWYYIGYLMKFGNWKFGFGNSAITRQWLPVDMYIGGAEHSVLHLLYSRFITMVFKDMRLIGFEEPFKKFRAHGLLIKNGAKMSKSKGNVVNPDEYINAFGADALRMYLMFLGPFEQGGDFSDTGIKGITRFLERTWRFFENYRSPTSIVKSDFGALKRHLHQTIKKVTEDIENLQYNTAVSALMILLNEFEANADSVSSEDLKIFLKILAPFAPHISEELWQDLNKNKKFHSIHQEKWPPYDEKLIKEETFELVVQVNGKVRGRVTAPLGITESEAKNKALEIEGVKQYLKTEPRKIIFVPNKLINFVI